MKKKLDFLTKAKLIYSGELLIFAIAFLIIAILEFTQVIKINETHHTFFNWLTLFGGTWLIADFLWALFSKKRQKKVAMLDKVLHLPLGIYLVSFDLFCLITQPTNQLIYQYGIPIAIGFISICYGFEAIYHFFKPIPVVLEMAEEEEKEALKKLEEQQTEEIIVEEKGKDAEQDVKND
ncbi:MAG: hypothetical protein GXY27_01725 [Erysipelotrichaceae bacterium]|jgi:hypothetical protein|nr:hypothetical protein [Erysipelotrichaceae bacterium]